MSGSSGIDALKLRLDRYATSIYKAKMENSTGSVACTRSVFKLTALAFRYNTILASRDATLFVF